MLATAPMDCQDDFTGGFVDVGNDIGDEGAQESLARPHRDAWCIPSHGEVFGEASEIGASGDGGRGSNGVDPRFAVRDAAQRRLPALFQLRSNQSIIGVTCRVAPFGKRGLVPGLLQFKFHDAAMFALTFHVSPFGLQRRLDCHGLEGSKKLPSDRSIDTGAAKTQAPGPPKHQVRTNAPINRPARREPSVDNGQPASAPPTGQQPREQRSSTAARLRAADLTIRVGRQLLLIAFELGPIDVAFMVIFEHNLAIFKRLGMAIALAGSAIDDLGALLALAVEVCPCVEGVLEDGDDVAIADRCPLETGQLLAVGWTRKVNSISGHRQQYLPRATEFAEPREDQPDRFLEPQVGIQAEADLPVPDVADRDADA
jgi:hypothetical protein